MNKKILFIILCLFSTSGTSTATEFDKVNIHGFLAQGFLQSNKNNFYAETAESGSFQFNEAGINFSTQMSPRLRLGLQLFARDIGEYGNDEVVIDWAYADYSYARWLGIRAGKLKMPLSLYSEIRDMDHLRTWIFLPQGVYHEIRRDTFATRKGIGLYGSLPSTIAGTFSYQAQIGVINMTENDGNTVFLEALSYPVWTVNNVNPRTSYLGRVNWRDPFKIEGLQLYGTYTTYDSDTNLTFFYADETFDSPFENEGWFAGMEYMIIDFVFAAEYFQEKNIITNFAAGIFPVVDFKREGFYFSTTYRFSEWFEAGIYYSDFDGDADGKEVERKKEAGFFTPKKQYTTHEYCLSTRFDINYNWIFKVEIHRFDGVGVLIQKDQETLEENDRTMDDWYLYAVKLSYNF